MFFSWGIRSTSSSGLPSHRSHQLAPRASRSSASLTPTARDACTAPALYSARSSIYSASLCWPHSATAENCQMTLACLLTAANRSLTLENQIHLYSRSSPRSRWYRFERRKWNLTDHRFKSEKGMLNTDFSCPVFYIDFFVNAELRALYSIFCSLVPPSSSI